MCFFFSLIAATFWVIVGYFVLFSSSKAVNGIRKFGEVLSIWIFVIAAVIPIAAAYVTFAGLCPVEEMFTRMHAPTSAQ